MAQDTAKEEVQGDFSREMSGLGVGGSTLTPDDSSELDALIDTSTKTEDTTNAETAKTAETTAETSVESISEPADNLQQEQQPSDTPQEAPQEATQQVEQSSETQESVSDPEEAKLEEEFPTPRHLNPEKKASWKTLRQIASANKKQAEEIRSKYESAVNDLVEFERGTKLPDPVKNELENLRQFRRMVDLAQDPEFTATYDKAIIGEEDKVFAKLKDLGLQDEAIQTIIKEGGILSKSKDDWGRLIFGALKGEEYEFTRAELKDSINKIFSLGDQRQQELQKAAQNFDQFTQRRTQIAQQREAEDFTQIKSEVETIQKQIPWANEPKKPVGGTPEQMMRYHRDVQQWEQNTKRFHMYLNPPDAKTRAQAAMAATGYFKVVEDVKALEQQNKQLRDQIARLQSVGKTVTQSAPVVKATAPKKDYLDMDDKDAMEQLMKDMGI